MLKYKYTNVVFSEVPEEITLAVSLTGCTIRCKGCHSPELWKDTGTPLTKEELDKLLTKNKGITCLLLLGGEHDIDSLIELFKHVKLNHDIKTAWYSGLDELPSDKHDIIRYLDYLKLGHYDEKLGGLRSITTNQCLYAISHEGIDDTCWMNDITYKLQKA